MSTRHGTTYCTVCGLRVDAGDGVLDVDGMSIEHYRCGPQHMWEPSADQLRIVDSWDSEDDLLEEQEVEDEMDALTNFQMGGDSERLSGYCI